MPISVWQQGLTVNDGVRVFPCAAGRRLSRAQRTNTLAHTYTHVESHQREEERKKAGDYTHLDILILHLLPWVSGVSILMVPPHPTPAAPLMPLIPLIYFPLNLYSAPTALLRFHGNSPWPLVAPLCRAFFVPFSNSRPSMLLHSLIYSSLAQLGSRFGMC